MSTKAEAVAAIDKAIGLVNEDGPITALGERMIVAALEHAKVCVGGIQELKKKRRAPATAVEA